MAGVIGKRVQHHEGRVGPVNDVSCFVITSREIVTKDAGVSPASGLPYVLHPPRRPQTFEPHRIARFWPEPQKKWPSPASATCTCHPNFRSLSSNSPGTQYFFTARCTVPSWRVLSTISSAKYFSSNSS